MMTEEQNEVLLPCPFCGSDHITEYSNRDFMYVRCEDCRTQTRVYKQYAEARAAWNRRAQMENSESDELYISYKLGLEKGLEINRQNTTEWTSEVPTEEGQYWLAIKDGDADWYAIVVEVEQSLGEYYVRSHLFEDAVYQDMFQCWCDCETNTENIMAADGCEVRWRKIPTPPLPGKEGM